MTAERERLAQAQAGLLRTLLRPGEPGPPGLQAPAAVKGGVARGLQAYRLNAQVLADKALAQVFPRVREVLGEEDFAAMALSLWRRHPPERGDVGEWGQVLPDFLQEQGVEAEWVDLARLEWAVHGCERALDQAFDAGSLGLLASESPAAIGLCLRAGSALLQLQAATWARWQFRRQPGQLARDRASPLDLHASQQEVGVGLVWLWVWRAPWKAQVCALPAGDAVFMAALMRGQSLQTALDAALAIEGFDFSTWLQAALQQAWLMGAQALGPQAGCE